MKNSILIRNILKLQQETKNIFSLLDDKASDEVIDARIRADSFITGSNLWVLIFAIFVASIGLNVNSTAVIIGAMLISPLMGPIIGIGYGAGINDFTLIKNAFKHLVIASAIALITSTLYFLITPLDLVKSELLARTSPTIWDVLIALFGGLAGIVGITRKEKGNVIPGVAIATALMPPLCTAGFGIATSNLHFFLGAFYLFTINFVFIAFSAFLVVKIFNITQKKYIDSNLAKKAHLYIAIIVFCTILPSTYLAYNLVQEELFKAKAKNFVLSNFNFENTNVAQIKIDAQTNEIKVFLIGDFINNTQISKIENNLKNNGLKNAKIKVFQNSEIEKINILALKNNISDQLLLKSQSIIEKQAKEINELNSTILTNPQIKQNDTLLKEEITTLFPAVSSVLVSYANENNNTIPVINIETSSKISPSSIQTLNKWLQIRLQNQNIKLIINKN